MASSTSCADSVSAIRRIGNDLILRVQVQPRAKRNEFAGLHAGAIKIRLTAPPVEGRANAALIAFLAEAFGIAKHQITLLQGETGRAKLLRICAPAQYPRELPVAPPSVP